MENRRDLSRSVAVILVVLALFATANRNRFDAEQLRDTDYQGCVRGNALRHAVAELADAVAFTLDSVAASSPSPAIRAAAARSLDQIREQQNDLNLAIRDCDREHGRQGADR